MADILIREVNGTISLETSGAALLSGKVSQATTAATNAGNSADLAEQWANEAEDVVVSGGEYSAKHYAAKAAAEKTAAEAAAASLTSAVDDVATNTAAVARFNAHETQGRPVPTPPTTGLGLGAGVYISGKAFENDGDNIRIRLKGAGTQTVQFQIYEGTPGSLTEVGSPVALAVTAGDKEFNIAGTFEAGQRWGIVVPAGTMYRTVATADDIGYYFGADATAAKADTTLSTTTRLEIGVDLTYQYSTASRDADQDAAIADLEVTTTDHESRLDVLDTALVTQVLGAQGTPASGLTTTAATYVLADKAIGTGRINQVRLNANASGVLSVKIFNETWEDGVGTLTQIGSDVTFNYDHSGPQSFACDIAVQRGQRVGFHNSTNGVQRVATTGYSGGYDTTTGNASSLTAAIVPNTSNQIQVGFDMTVQRNDRWYLNLRNSDRIIVLGDSFSESDYTQRGKSWLAKVSLFTDWNFSNFARSGDTAAENLVRLRANTTTLGVLPYRDRPATYALIYVGQNDAAGTSLADFLEDMRQLIETVKGLGATPILVSPHSLDPALYGLGFSIIYRNLAEEHGCLFVDVTEWARINDYGTRYNGFWNSTHPGVRTNQIQVAPVMRLLDQIDAPRQSVKLFRKRDGVSVSTVADLIFNTHYDRAKLFREILVGTGALKTANENLYDELYSVTAGEIETINSEYEELQEGGSIALGDYSLLEITLPTNAKNIDQLSVTLSDTGATVYARNVLGTLTDGLPVGSWVTLNGGAGTWRLSNSQLKRFMRQDKLSLLIYKSGGIASFFEPVISWVGTPIAKPRKVGKTWGGYARGTELLSNPDLGTSTSWTATGTVSHGAPADSCLPRGSTGRVTVDNSNYVSQSVSFAADTGRTREAEIRINARVFPAIFASGGTYPGGASITQDSFDWGQLQIEVSPTGGITGAGRVPYREPVGLWWGDVVVRTVVPMDVTGLTLYIRGASGSVAIEASKASVKFVEA